MAKELSVEQVQFLDEYLKSFNLEDSMVNTDIEEAEAKAALVHPQVTELIDKEQRFRFRKLGITPSRTLLTIAEMAYKTPCILDESDPDYESRKEVLEFIDTKEQQKALELLCKFHDVLNQSTKKNVKGDELLTKITNAEEGLKMAKKLIGVD